MKKFVLTLVFLVVLSTINFADDGTIHGGGKTCPQGQTCLASPDNPGRIDNTTFTDIFDFLKALFK